MTVPAPDPAASLGSELRAHREHASQSSGGISDDVIYAAIERRLLALGASGAVLDFGAGRGGFTSRLQASGRYARVTAADLFPRPADLPDDVQWAQGDLNDRLPLDDASFDVIVAVEVIEHLENPRAVVRELFRLLRPGGVVVLSTPNNESWRSLAALLLRGHFIAFTDPCYPAHITALVRKDLERILKEAGFVDPTFDFTDVGGIPGAPSRTWQTLLGRGARGLRFSDNVLVCATKPRPTAVP